MSKFFERVCAAILLVGMMVVTTILAAGGKPIRLGWVVIGVSWGIVSVLVWALLTTPKVNGDPWKGTNL